MSWSFRKQKKSKVFNWCDFDKQDVKIEIRELPTYYWLPKLHKRPYKSRFISNSSLCATTILSQHIESTLTADKDHVIKI